VNDSLLAIDRRACLRALGPVAWVILEELSLRADHDGAPTAVTTRAMDLADAIGVGRDAVSRGLRRLRERGLVTIEAVRDDDGRFVASRYAFQPVGVFTDIVAAACEESTAKVIPGAASTVNGKPGTGQRHEGVAPERQPRRRAKNTTATRQPNRDDQLSLLTPTPA